MKSCPYCGTVYSDGVSTCAIDQTRLDAGSGELPPPSDLDLSARKVLLPIKQRHYILLPSLSIAHGVIVAIGTLICWGIAANSDSNWKILGHFSFPIPLGLMWLFWPMVLKRYGWSRREIVAGMTLIVIAIVVLAALLMAALVLLAIRFGKWSM
jgi:hypothetical protein